MKGRKVRRNYKNKCEPRNREGFTTGEEYKGQGEQKVWGMQIVSP